MLFAVLMCGVECVCGLLLAPYVELCVFARVFVSCYVIVCFVYDVSCDVVWFACFVCLYVLGCLLLT